MLPTLLAMLPMPLLTLLLMLLTLPTKQLSNPETLLWTRRGSLMWPPFFLSVSHATLRAQWRSGSTTTREC
jgi:hypothetical protein